MTRKRSPSRTGKRRRKRKRRSTRKKKRRRKKRTSLLAKTRYFPSNQAMTKVMST